MELQYGGEEAKRTEVITSITHSSRAARYSEGRRSRTQERLVENMALVDRSLGFNSLFVTQYDPVGEVKGFAEQILFPVAIATLIAWILMRFWAKNGDWRTILAMSVPFGTLLVAVSYFLVLTGYLTIEDNAFTLPGTTFRAGLMSILFLPTLVILGPIVAGCVIRARRGQVLLPNIALYGVSVFCIILQYVWLGLFLSG